MSFRDVKIKTPDRIGTRGCEWRHALEAWAEDIGDLRKRVSWVPASERESRDSELGEARRICALRAPRVGWVESWRCKSSQHRKIVSLSSCQITFNSKVIKFRTWTNFVNFVFSDSRCLFHASVYLAMQQFLILYSLYTSLLHSFSMWLMVSSLSPLALHFLFFYLLATSALISSSWCQHESPRPSFTSRLNHPSLLVGLQDYILYRHRAIVCMF